MAKNQIEEFKLPQTNGVKITQEEWDELQEDLKITKFLLQEMKDLLEGRIRSANIIEYRNTYSRDDFGILDATHDLIIDFELIEEMTKLVECKVNFWIRDFVSGVKDI